MKKNTDSAWLQAALDYIPAWLGFQLERHQQVGCAVAIVRGQERVAEFALGSADMQSGERLTPRHRFRIASHSKTFTASGVMLLREQGKLGLDDPIGRHVGGLHKSLAKARVGELLSHGAGVIRDGDDSGQFLDRRPFYSRAELRADLAKKQPLEPGLQLKYSNHGYGLLGLMIEEITGTDYASWIDRHVVAPAGLRETVPDMPFLPKGAPMARGHSAEFPFGQRLIVPGDNVCDAIAPAGGFVATAADTACFFAQLAPDSGKSILSAASRREMLHRRWRDNHSAQESYYGLGTMMGGAGPREWAGHTGGLQGFVSRTARFAESGFTISVLCNALDAWSYAWVDGIHGILSAFRQHGAPGRKQAAWNGRWWSLWGATDLVAMGKVVCQVAPAMAMPFDGAATEIEVTDKTHGRIARTSSYNSPGQPVRLVHDRKGRPTALWVGGSKLLTREAMVAEVTQRYGGTRR
ncbi:serine hydrolase [Variovorax sp. KK3]|uniref:serine hydrolase domain-containing protein n=1 Tax=Variovorax sp. KK3 TaxID=1855728 RepID=UPI00097C459E|nr:serine hydrolase domain-containing protein [Variovorax sp. KK3]